MAELMLETVNGPMADVDHPPTDRARFAVDTAALSPSVVTGFFDLYSSLINQCQVHAWEVLNLWNTCTPGKKRHDEDVSHSSSRGREFHIDMINTIPTAQTMPHLRMG